MLKGKNIVVGVTGGIAAYKACDVVSRFVKNGAHVDVIMTKHAAEFVTPLTFESLTNTAAVTDMFAHPIKMEIEHISLAKKADLFLIVPATANIIAKMGNGIADDMLSTTLLATKKPVVVCPAMNTGMYTNVFFKENLDKLAKAGAVIVEPQSGRLACGDIGAGKLADAETIFKAVMDTLFPLRDLAGARVLITAGGTIERLDSVRFLTNDSSGKMGAALAQNALERGAEVTIVAGRHTAKMPGAANIIPVSTTREMHDAVMAHAARTDIFVMAAAPCDFRPETYSETKIKAKELTVRFLPNPDIAAGVGKAKGNAYLAIFAAETDNVIENAEAKLVKKNADLVVANDVTAFGAGFDTDTNIVTLVSSDAAEELPLMTKYEAAGKIWDKIASDIKKKTGK